MTDETAKANVAELAMRWGIVVPAAEAPHVAAGAAWLRGCVAVLRRADRPT